MNELVQLGRRPSTATGLRGALEGCVSEPARVLTRAIDVTAYASDASLYRLVPRAVVQPKSEDEVRALFAVSAAQKIPLTFRTAGTSLSGQAVTDGLLIDLSKHWGKIEVLDGGARVRVQPGVIGRVVNAHLARYGRRMGPDPASIDTCMIGGIISNNSSGMCCGTRENAYQTLDSMRFMLPTGELIDTADPACALPPRLAEGLLVLAARVRGDRALVEKIRAKYRIKNTMGYALNAFLDHDRPEQILAHLIVGSEGTLAFISEAVLRTLPDYPFKRAGLLIFEDAARAFAAVAPIEASGARAIEFMDDACLRAVKISAEAGCALLVEYQAENEEQLAEYRAAEARVSASLQTLTPIRFTEDAAERAALWKMRKGLLPAAGATKRSGETVIIEDVAYPLEKLPAATAALRSILLEYGYDRALIFGHAKDGNCHFALTQSFNEEREIVRYEKFMDALAEMTIANEGSLKAEHGTGRNMAPYVEAEWGKDAFRIMRELKALIDPAGMLNPGVILNPDPRAHVAHLKDLPPVEEEIDRCIECGFCEPVCPSRRLTMTPRQRIVVRREMARLETRGGEQATLAELRRDFEYAGIETCAADGMCASACPVKIDTGSLVKRLRGEEHGLFARTLARLAAKSLRITEAFARLGLRLVALRRPIQLLERLLRTRLPKWSGAIPRPPWRAIPKSEREGAELVFVPSCSARVFGGPGEVMLVLADRSGLRTWIPREAQCCGLPWGSKGFQAEHAELLGRLVDRLWAWSERGRLPIAIDSTSCLQSIKASAALLDPEHQQRLAAMQLRDPIELARDLLLPRLRVTRLDKTVVLHPTCAARKLELDGAMKAIAEHCATKVIVPINLACCAMAGDRGLTHPELTRAATAAESAELAAAGASGFYSTNPTCELAMTQATGAPYRSLLYLLEESSSPPKRSES